MIGLRKQLVLISLVTLALPWAGLQILQKLEQTLKEGQLMAMQATGRAISVALEADATEHSLKLDHTPPEASPLVAHPIQNDMQVDGYFDDWRDFEWAPQRLTIQPGADTPMQNQLYLAATASTVFFYLEVADASREFYRPTSRLDATDHLILQMPEKGEVSLFTAAPGQLTAVWKHSEGQNEIAHAIKGVWHEEVGSYRLEWQVPRAFLRNGLKMQVHDGATKQVLLSTGSVASPVIMQVEALNQMLAKFVEPGERVYLVDAQAYLRADAGSLYTGERFAYPGITHKMIKWVLGAKPQQLWHNPAVNGQLLEPSAQGLQADLATQNALASGSRVIFRSYAPLQLDGWHGFVVVDKNSNTVDSLVTGVSGTLLLYSLLASLFAGALCLFYATWLSFRIRRLSRNVESALDAKGNMQVDFGTRVMNDEIGQLSKSFMLMLNRVKEYTEYLQSLASKLSHELRTPLAVVKSSLENMQHYTLPEQAKQYADRAQAGAERLTFVLNAMSAANRLEQSLLQAEMEEVDIKIMLSELVAAYEGTYPSHKFKLDLEPHGPQHIIIAPDLVAQMMDKLIENARDFAEPGSNIEISAISNKGFLQLRVINVGPPLPQAMQTQVFDSLVSLRDNPGESSHLGLGLYIVRLIARFHQGKVRAFNDVSEGKVVFEVLLPWKAGAIRT